MSCTCDIQDLDSGWDVCCMSSPDPLFIFPVTFHCLSSQITVEKNYLTSITCCALSPQGSFLLLSCQTPGKFMPSTRSSSGPSPRSEGCSWSTQTSCSMTSLPRGTCPSRGRKRWLRQGSIVSSQFGAPMGPCPRTCAVTALPSRPSPPYAVYHKVPLLWRLHTEEHSLLMMSDFSWTVGLVKRQQRGRRGWMTRQGGGWGTSLIGNGDDDDVLPAFQSSWVLWYLCIHFKSLLFSFFSLMQVSHLCTFQSSKLLKPADCFDILSLWKLFSSCLLK